MKILVMSRNGDIMPLAVRMANEGHEVILHNANGRGLKAGTPAVERAVSWRPRYKGTDLAICDGAGYGQHKDLLKSSGIQILGVSQLFDELHFDHVKNLRFLTDLDIPTVAAEVYPNPLLIGKEWEDNRYIMKYTGALSLGPVTAFIPDLAYLEYELSLASVGAPVILMNWLDGITVNVVGFFNGRDLLRPVFLSFPTYGTVDIPISNMQPVSGTMITSIRRKAPIVEQTIEKLIPALKEDNYRGMVSISCIVTEAGVSAIDVSANLDINFLTAMFEGTNEKVSDVMFEIAAGTRSSIDVASDRLISVQMSVAPWPYDPLLGNIGTPILGVIEENAKHVWLNDVVGDGADDQLYYIGESGIVGHCTARSGDMRESRRRAHRTVSNIHFAAKQSRKDIGLTVDDDMLKLKEYGLI